MKFQVLGRAIFTHCISLSIKVSIAFHWHFRVFTDVEPMTDSQTIFSVSEFSFNM